MTEISLRPLTEVPPPELEALASEVFANEEPSELLAEVLAAEAALKERFPTSADQRPFGLAAYRGDALIGWTEGFQVGANQLHMLNSGVAAGERRNGVYSALVRAVLAHSEAQGYSTVRSLHVAANSPVIIAKLRLGFQIVGFECSEVYGPLVQLKYFIGEARRRLYRARTASLRPAPR